MSAFLFLSVVVLLLFHAVGLALLIRNQRWLHWPLAKRPSPEGKHPVTVIVPARNEQADLAGCLRSLLAQTNVDLRIIVVNDHSEDHTGRIADEIAATDSRVKVIHNPLLRSGWLGKHNAMQSALEHVNTDLLLLTDADVYFQPSCIATAIAELKTQNLDLLSIYPRFEFVSFCETMLVPIYVAGTFLLLSPKIDNPHLPHAMAVGAFILVRCSSMDAINGFDSIKSEILDDVALARTFKQHGYSIGLRSAPDLIRVRFFKGNRDAFFGVTKHLLGIVQRCIWLAPLLAFAPLAMYGLLLSGVVYGLWSGPAIIAILASISLALHYGALLLSRESNSFSALKALAFPAMSVQFACSCCRAIYLYLSSGHFRWRGRIFDVRSARTDDLADKI